MERVRIAVTQFKARDIESFDDFAGHVDGALWQGSDCLVFPEYFTSELLTTLPEEKTTPRTHAGCGPRPRHG